MTPIQPQLLDFQVQLKATTLVGLNLKPKLDYKINICRCSSVQFEEYEKKQGLPKIFKTKWNAWTPKEIFTVRNNHDKVLFFNAVTVLRI